MTQERIQDFVIAELCSLTNLEADNLSDAVNIDKKKLTSIQLQVFTILSKAQMEDRECTKAELMTEVIHACNPTSVMEIFFVGLFMGGLTNNFD